LAGFVMMYLSTMLFRNLAFYRFEPKPRLKDMGFQIVPDLEHDGLFRFLMNVPMNLSMWSMGFVCVLSVFSKSGYPPFAVNMLRRVMWMLSIGHCMRFLTYISTTLPGATERCLPGHLTDMDPPKPSTWSEIFFTRIAMNPGNNCGDLMFSGHMLGIITPVLMIGHYGDAVLVKNGYISRFTFQCVIIFLIMMIIAQGFLIISMRNHYSSDVVVSCYITPLLWNFYVGYVYPDDAVPPALADYEASERSRNELAEISSALDNSFSPRTPNNLIVLNSTTATTTNNNNTNSSENRDRSIR
jgi:hypothetical protein